MSALFARDAKPSEVYYTRHGVEVRALGGLKVRVPGTRRVVVLRETDVLTTEPRPEPPAPRPEAQPVRRIWP